MAELDKLQKDNLQTWQGFLSITKWVMIGIALVLILMAIFLV
jgi:hypothetical protein